jgi:hypothetical protein
METIVPSPSVCATPAMAQVPSRIPTDVSARKVGTSLRVLVVSASVRTSARRARIVATRVAVELPRREPFARLINRRERRVASAPPTIQSTLEIAREKCVRPLRQLRPRRQLLISSTHQRQLLLPRQNQSPLFLSPLAVVGA